MSDTNWIKDPKLQHISTEKLLFLQALLKASTNLTQKDMIPFLFAFQKKMQESSISFSQEELHTIFEVVKQYASDEEMRMLTMMQGFFH